MRYIILLSLLILGSCCQQTGNTQKMQTQIDSLQNKLTHTYRPGFGEFMLGIQIHHAKIWYAGNAQNWPLVQFELNEIKESLDGIREYCPTGLK